MAKTIAATKTVTAEVLAVKTEPAPRNCCGDVGLGKLVLTGAADINVVVPGGTMGAGEESTKRPVVADPAGTWTVSVTLGVQLVVAEAREIVTVRVTLRAQLLDATPEDWLAGLPEAEG
jgi:hypothetical protein